MNPYRLTICSTLLAVFSLTTHAHPVDAAGTVAELGHARELRIYKQRLRINAEVQCRYYEKRPMYCTAHIREPLMETIHPEQVLGYSGLTIGDSQFDVETTPDGNIKFRGDKKQYMSGKQEVDIDIIYIR